MDERGEAAGLRALPAVERLLQQEPLRSAARERPRSLAVDAARQVLERSRAEVRAGNGAVPGLAELAVEAARELERRTRQNLVAVMECTSKSLLPEHYRNIDRGEVLQRVAQLSALTK